MFMKAQNQRRILFEVQGFHRKKDLSMENKKYSISLKNMDYEHFHKFAKDWLEQRGLLDEFGIPKKIP
jgi:hypothetical protein